MQKLELNQSNLNKMKKNYWEYCEGIILPTGDYCLATYGHINTMIEYSKFTDKEIYDMMPIDSAPIIWLCQFTKCLAVNYDMSIAPYGVNEKQLKTYRKLVKEKLILDKLYVLEENAR